MGLSHTGLNLAAVVVLGPGWQSNHKVADYHPKLSESLAGRLVEIEIKAGATLGGKDVRGLQAMASAAGKRWVRGVVLHTGSEVIPFTSNLHGLPMSQLWAARK